MTNRAFIKNKAFDFWEINIFFATFLLDVSIYIKDNRIFIPI
jgi:hypothetical protein